MKPMWEDITDEHPKLAAEYYDADANTEIFKEYGISDIPAAIFLDKDGREILRLQGAQNKEYLRQAVESNLDK